MPTSLATSLRRRSPLPPTSAFGLIVRRALWLVPTLGTVVMITFGLVHLAPGGPWDETNSVVAGSVHRLSSGELHALRAKYGLDEPLPVQLLVYVRNLARLDLGQSYRYQGESVRSLIARSWWRSAVVGGLSFCLALGVGVGLGLVAAVKRRTLADHLVTGFAAVAASVPSFVTAMMLVIVLSVGLHHLTGAKFFLPSGGFGLDAHLVLPVVTIALLPAAYLARLTRASVVDTLAREHVAAAKERGLPERTILLRHVLPNSLVPVISAVGPMVAHLLTGAVVAEEIFHIPGLGRLFVEAVTGRDYPTILGTTVLLAVVVAAANLAVDVVYTLLDPRMSLS